MDLRLQWELLLAKGSQLPLESELPTGLSSQLGLESAMGLQWQLASD